MKDRAIKLLANLAPRAEFLSLLALVMLRLYLTADRDIAAWNAPHDEFWYVHKAFTGVWAGQYSEMSFVHSPVYVLWLELLNTYGVAARFGIDVAWIAGVMALAVAVRNFTKARVVSVILAAFLLLHPYTIFIFDRSLAETLLAVTIAIGLAAGLEIWTTRAGTSGRRLIPIVLFSVMFALSCNLRREGIALIAPLLLLAGLSLFSWKLWWADRNRKGLSLGLIVFVMPLVATLCLSLALSGLNYFKWGTFAQDDLSSAGYEAAVVALSRIDAGRTPPEVSISTRMLEKAYSASPTFNELRPYLEGPVGQKWRGITSEALDARGEIGTGWFYWAFREAAANAGWHFSAPHAEQKYRAVSQELHVAFEKGTLGERHSFVPMTLDPDIQKWIPALPASLGKMVRMAVLPSAKDAFLPKENATPGQFAEYEWVTGRRNPLAAKFGTAQISYLADSDTAKFVRLSQVMALVFLACLLLSFLLAFFVGGLDSVLMAAFACLVFCVTRVALLTLLDASSWNGEQARYVLPLLPFFACAGVLGMAALSNQFRALLVRRIPHTSTGS